ncbi:MAG: heme-binding protein [Candidatus Neomarinimicrobiota bacterium]
MISRLIYTVYEVKNLIRWKRFIHTMYGLTLKETNQNNEFEAVVDPTGCRIIFREGKTDDIVAIGFESNSLDNIENSLISNNFIAEWGSEIETKSRYSNKLLKTIDPIGLQIEFVDVSKSYNLYTEPDHDLEFDCGDLGLGHVTLNGSVSPEDMRYFYADTLCMGLSDCNEPTLGFGMTLDVVFFHTNKRHHSIAYAQIWTGKKINHFQIECVDRNSVGLGYKRCKKAKIPIAHSVGVHPNDNQISFYVRNPSAFQCELGAESTEIKDNHEAKKFYGISVWGHESPLMQTLIYAKNMIRYKIKMKLGTIPKTPTKLLEEKKIMPKENTKLKLDEAVRIATAAIAHARKENMEPMAVTVVDAAGTIITSQTEENCALIRPDIAYGKAWGCIGLGFSSRALHGLYGALPDMNPAFDSFGAISKNRLVPSPGGVFILRDNEVVGAVGVSGDMPDKDEACSIAGIKAANLQYRK